MPTVEFPDILEFLFQPMRYKVGFGGRGAGKSWAYARALIIRALEKKTRILCTREMQSSIRDSVHKLLCDQIERLGVSHCFTVTERSIKAINGSEFFFEGLYRNVNRIKSLEGIDYCWVEEAESVTRDSWNILTPTIRKDDSEIWISFNTGFESDDTYQMFVVNPPDNSVVKLINYYDNPWFPDVLKTEMEQDKARDPLLYEHKWLGKPSGAGGRVFPAFDKKLHVREFDNDLIRDKGHCIMSMDPHQHYYPFVLWLAVIPKNDRGHWPEDFCKYVYNEWPSFDRIGGFYHEMRKKAFFTGSLKELSTEIYGNDGSEFGFHVKHRYIDSRYAKGSGSWSWSNQTEGIVQLFSRPENGGLKFETPYEKAIDAQRQVIHDDMLYMKDAPISVYNEPSLFVAPHCQNVILSLLNHRLETDSERESEKYKEPSDCMRICYAGLKDFKHQSAQRPRPKVRVASSWMG